MKTFTTLFVLIIMSFFSNAILSQPDNENLKSVVQVPPNYNPNIQQVLKSQITTDGFENFYLGVDFGEPYIATNPTNPLNSVTAYNTNSFYTTLDGYTWSKINVGFPGYGILGDPCMCFDSLGNLFYVQLYQNGSTYGIAVVKSTDKGFTWSSPVSANSNNGGLEDKEWITADQTAGPYSNNLYIGWRAFYGAGGMMFIRSTDHGASWSSPIPFSGGQGAYVAVGPNGNIQGGSVYFACLGISVARSTDGGATFGPQVNIISPPGPGVICYGRNTVKNCIRTDAMPRMAADNSYTSTRGNVYVVYAANPPGPDNADVYLVRSTDYGQTWSTPLRVNDDNTTTDQWMPSVFVDKMGRVYMTWYDSREDPTNNLLTRLWGAVSTNGGQSFGPNFAISDVLMNPNNMAVGQGQNQANYMGDYIGCSAINRAGYASWMDARNNSLGSYTGFFPDFAMLVNPQTANVKNNDSTFVTITMPGTRGTLFSAIKYTASLDSAPTSGSIQFSFVNGKDSIITSPDSVRLRIKTVGTVNPRLFTVTVKGYGLGGTPVHVRTFGLLVNVSALTVGTNRGTICSFKVNGITYNQTTQLIFNNGSVVTLQALGPFVSGGNRYVYQHWSDNGDTTHNVTMNSNLTLTAFYKVQYSLIMQSTIGHIIGAGFYDSASNVTFRVDGKSVPYNGAWYDFKGWNGSGNGSYTSPDSSGNDTAHTLQLLNTIVESARWLSEIGINQISSEVPKVYKLYQNFPNPFNPSTTINFDIVKSGNVSIVLYNLLGQEVKTILNTDMEPGKYKLTFSADEFASGVYFYRIRTKEFTDVKKMLLLK